MDSETKVLEPETQGPTNEKKKSGVGTAFAWIAGGAALILLSGISGCVGAQIGAQMGLRNYENGSDISALTPTFNIFPGDNSGGNNGGNGGNNGGNGGNNGGNGGNNGGNGGNGGDNGNGGNNGNGGSGNNGGDNNGGNTQTPPPSDAQCQAWLDASVYNLADLELLGCSILDLDVSGLATADIGSGGIQADVGGGDVLDVDISDCIEINILGIGLQVLCSGN